MQPLKVNFTDQEAKSKVREIPPSGEYVVAITDGELKSVQPGKTNSGKPFWQLRFVIQSGTYQGTTLMSTVMLFDGALYSLSQLMKALDYNIESGDFVLPPLTELLGKVVLVRGFKMPPKTDKDGRELGERFEIKGYKRYDAGMTVKSTQNQFLP